MVRSWLTSWACRRLDTSEADGLNGFGWLRAERRREELPQRDVARRARAGKTQRHPGIVDRGVAPVRREQVVPPGQQVREVAIAFVEARRVVNPVHVRCDDHPAQR